MTKTSVQVSFGLYALEIKQDSLPSMSNLQPFSKANDLRTDKAASKQFATLEPNFWLLDGTYKFVPDILTTVHVGIISLAMSTYTGAFDTPPVLTVDFTQIHSVATGITLRFSRYSADSAGYINVKYYNSSYSLICSDDYYPTSTEFSTGKTVNNFQRIVITFYTTSKPFRYLRLQGIDFGELVYFTPDMIQTAEVVEECDMIGAEARIDTFELGLFSNNTDFSILNPAGEYASLTQHQPLAVYEIIDDEEEVFIGQFYLDKWKNISQKQISFSCIDLLGVLETKKCYGGIWLGSGILLEDLIELLLQPVAAPYEIHPDLYGITMKGWLSIGTYRTALQQIVFAAGAYVDCSRDRLLKIYPARIAEDITNIDINIPITKKGTEQSLELRATISGVEITAHDYSTGSASKSLFSGTLPIGDYTIEFSEAMHTLSVTGATVSSSGANYAILHVTVQGSVTLSGLTYNDAQRVYSITNPGVTAVIKPNILKVTGATMVSSYNGQAVAQRVYDYNMQRYKQILKMYIPEIAIGHIALIDSFEGEQIRASVEKISLDLARGFKAEAEMIGVKV
jgi:hypothetical protein